MIGKEDGHKNHGVKEKISTFGRINFEILFNL